MSAEGRDTGIGKPQLGCALVFLIFLATLVGLLLEARGTFKGYRDESMRIRELKRKDWNERDVSAVELYARAGRARVLRELQAAQASGRALEKAFRAIVEDRDWQGHGVYEAKVLKLEGQVVSFEVTGKLLKEDRSTGQLEPAHVKTLRVKARVTKDTIEILEER